MAKSKVDFWLTDDGLDLIRSWARKGLTNEEIINNIGAYSGDTINQFTFYRWLNKYSEISEAIKEGRFHAIALVENALMQSALSGNTAAQIFYLKNRDKRNWQDKVEQVADQTQINILRELLERNKELAANKYPELHKEDEGNT